MVRVNGPGCYGSSDPLRVARSRSLVPGSGPLGPRPRRPAFCRDRVMYSCFAAPGVIEITARRSSLGPACDATQHAPRHDEVARHDHAVVDQADPPRLKGRPHPQGEPGRRRTDRPELVRPRPVDGHPSAERRGNMRGGVQHQHVRRVQDRHAIERRARLAVRDDVADRQVLELGDQLRCARVVDAPEVAIDPRYQPPR